MKRFFSFLLLLGFLTQFVYGQSRPAWREASAAELEAFLPARAPVEGERIETEMRSASGIINSHGQLIAGVVLITAGYAAQGKYSHYLLTQSKLTLNGGTVLAPGAYVIGSQHAEDGLFVHIYDAATGTERGAVTARPITQFKRVESFHIWALPDRRIIQIGRFMLPYSVETGK